MLCDGTWLAGGDGGEGVLQHGLLDGGITPPARLEAAWQVGSAFGKVTRWLVESTQAAAQHFGMRFQWEKHLDCLGEKTEE